MTIKDSQRCAQYDVELLFIIQALFLEHTEQACILYSKKRRMRSCSYILITSRTLSINHIRQLMY